MFCRGILNLASSSIPTYLLCWCECHPKSYALVLYKRIRDSCWSLECSHRAKTSQLFSSPIQLYIESPIFKERSAHTTQCTPHKVLEESSLRRFSVKHWNDLHSAFWCIPAHVWLFPATWPHICNRFGVSSPSLATVEASSTSLCPSFAMPLMSGSSMEPPWIVAVNPLKTILDTLVLDHTAFNNVPWLS